MAARKLSERRDMLLPTYRRQVKRRHAEFDHLVAQANEQFPGIFVMADHHSPVVIEQDSSLAVRVNVTMPVAEWDLIDSLIASGKAKSRADYFRQLHYAKQHR